MMRERKDTRERATTAMAAQCFAITISLHFQTFSLIKSAFLKKFDLILRLSSSKSSSLCIYFKIPYFKAIIFSASPGRHSLTAIQMQDSTRLLNLSVESQAYMSYHMGITVGKTGELEKLLAEKCWYMEGNLEFGGKLYIFVHKNI